MSPKTHVVMAWSPEWHFQEVGESLRGTIGSPWVTGNAFPLNYSPSPLFSGSAVDFSSFVFFFFAVCCLTLDPKPCGQQIIGGNPEKTEPKENFSLSVVRLSCFIAVVGSCLT